jgi:hypothetical protein
VVALAFNQAVLLMVALGVLAVERLEVEQWVLVIPHLPHQAKEITAALAREVLAVVVVEQTQ